MPAAIYGIEKYLGSGLVKGIGPVFAKSIVSKFGTETLNVIDNEPDRLLEVPKLGTGKTTTTQGIIAAFKARNMQTPKQRMNNGKDVL